MADSRTTEQGRPRLAAQRCPVLIWQCSRALAPHRLHDCMAVNKAVPDSPLQLGSELVDKKVRRDDNYPAVHDVVSAQGFSGAYSDKEWHALERLRLKDERAIDLPDFILQQLGGPLLFSPWLPY